MQNHLEQIEIEIVQRIYKLFLEKFNGNKSEFARASQCSETTIRRILRNEQGITINLLLRLCNALEVEVNEIFDGLYSKEEGL
ncbi:MAG: helix-turn-helix transcriptional regulator [Bacteroidota bacterium]